ncbi:MAG: hypothetical protein GY940_27375 [bacterium]|nr:hypothetical protein [bacterium]
MMPLTFDQIKTIAVNDESTWKERVFLTFDIDWASDEELSLTLDILEEHSVKATIFVTHGTPLLERMSENPNLELGIHPNFNPLLYGAGETGNGTGNGNGQPAPANIREVLEYYLEIVPDAVSVRSHSMTQNSGILEMFCRYGLKTDCNHFIPYHAGIPLAPWEYWFDGLIRVPYFWEDDVHCLYNYEWNVEPIANAPGLKVFDFHPVHVFLNTSDLDEYEKYKKRVNNGNGLSREAAELIQKGYGTRNFLLDLITF